MVRSRLAFLALASSLLGSGCASWHHSECHSGGWFSRFRLASRTSAAPCECDAAMPMTSDGTMIVPPNAFVPPNGFVPPGGFAAPPPAIMTTPPGTTVPPRIVPVPQTVPQAQPVPYTG